MREFSSRRNSEIGRINDSSRESSTDFTKDVGKTIDNLKSIIDSLPKIDEDNEINRDAIYGIDQEMVRKEEKREFRFNSNQNSNISDEDQEHDEELDRMLAELSAIDEKISRHL